MRNSNGKTFDEIARRMLSIDEGKKQSPYLDSRGFWTIGIGRFIGRNLSDLKLSSAVMDLMLAEDLAVAIKDAESIFGEDAFRSWEIGRRLAIVNLLFNLGKPKFLQFRKTIAAVRRLNWDLAAEELGFSLWATQVGFRAQRVIAMVKTGEIDALYF